MKKISRIVAVAVLALSLGGPGLASAATGSIETTGPDSNNQVEVNNNDERRLKNRNKVRVYNSSTQRSSTGDAEVSHNTTGGDAETGEATTDNLTSASVSISNANSSSAALEATSNGDDEGTIENTGPDSNNQVTFNNNSEVKVRNDNYLSLNNRSYQSARSGDALVEGNTTGGSATSGDATSINTSEFEISIEN